MTFYEAALQVLEKEGKPLHFKSITERAVTDKLLSHIGKDPEAVMYSRLAAMARRKGDRRVVATEAGTFGLLDWGVQEDPVALDAQVLPVPDETEAPYRPRERHPVPSPSNVRMAGRGERFRKGRDDREERGRRKLAPLAELAFEALSQETSPVPVLDLASTLREGEKVAQDLGAEALLQALREDNRRRQSQDRRPLFVISESNEISVDKAGAPGAGVPVELQAAFAQALGVPLEGERRPEGQRGDSRPERLGPGAQRVVQQVREHQKTIGRLLRRRFSELEVGAAELVSQTLLEAHGFREVRAAKRGKDGLVFTAKRRDGLLDIRYAVRVVRGSREVTRQDILDLRTDVSAYNTQAGLVIAGGEAGRDSRSEAILGSVLISLWAGDALSEKLVEKKVGATSITLEVPDLDEGYFRRIREQGDLDDRRREERRIEREAREERERAEKAARAAAPPPASASVGSTVDAPPAEGAETPALAKEVVPAPASEATAPPPATIEVRVDLSSSPSVFGSPTPSPEALAAELAKKESEASMPTADATPKPD